MVELKESNLKVKLLSERGSKELRTVKSGEKKGVQQLRADSR